MNRELTLKLTDISCTGCAEDMEIFLRNQYGILEAHVNYAAHTIDIQYDPELIDYPAVIQAARKVANIREIITEQS